METPRVCLFCKGPLIRRPKEPRSYWEGRKYCCLLCSRRGTHTKHGQAKSEIERTPTYISWAGMMGRANKTSGNAANKRAYAHVDMCERWRDFRNFLADMGERPPGTSLDRIDGTLGYHPHNTRWASREEQGSNRRDNILITFDDSTMTLSQWARLIGISHGALAMRIKKGWPLEKALTTPRLKCGKERIMGFRRYLEQNG